MVPAAIAAPVPAPVVEPVVEPMREAVLEPAAEAAVKPAEEPLVIRPPEQARSPEPLVLSPAERAGREASAPGPAAPDHAEPARRRMIAMLQAAGVRGMTIRGIAEQLAADGQEVAQQTIYRWLNEELVAGRAQDASYGRWKWRPGRPPDPEPG
jgi:hypothetical protein